MPKYLPLLSLLTAVAVCDPAHARDGEFGTPVEARAMLERAVEAVAADKVGAFDRFNHNHEEFRDRDLFIFCFNGGDGKFNAHEALVGRDVRSFRDVGGKPYGAEMYHSARADTVVEVSYTSPRPGSTDLTEKRAYVTRVGDQVCGVSVYRLKSWEQSAH